MRDLAIRNTHATVVTINGDSDARDANGDVVILDESAITTEVAKLQTAYDNNAYQRSRATEYPSITDQLDDIYHNGVDEWKKTIKAVKDKYPKE
jgi:hypothetical protein